MPKEVITIAIGLWRVSVRIFGHFPHQILQVFDHILLSYVLNQRSLVSHTIRRPAQIMQRGLYPFCICICIWIFISICICICISSAACTPDCAASCANYAEICGWSRSSRWKATVHLLFWSKEEYVKLLRWTRRFCFKILCYGEVCWAGGVGGSQTHLSRRMWQWWGW